MSTWFGISTEFTLKPDYDPTALAAAIAVYHATTMASVARLLDAHTLRVASEGEMSHNTAERLRAGLADLVIRFGNGQPVRVHTIVEHDTGSRAGSYWLGPKAAVVTALAQELRQREATLTAEYDRQLARLAGLAEHACVATEDW